MNARALLSRFSILTGLILLPLGAPAIGQITQADRLAGEGLVFSAKRLIHGDPDVPGRAARIVTLLKATKAIDPENIEACRLLSEVYALQGQVDKAVETVGICLEKQPEDVALSSRWLALSLSKLQQAEDRAAFLEELLSRPELSDALRSDTAVQLALIRRGQGRPHLARAMFLRALRTDPMSPQAISAMLDQDSGGQPGQQASLVFRLHTAQPRNAALNLRVALMLGQFGLHNQALKMFETIQQLRRQRGERLADPAILSAWCNALLDAGKSQDALEMIDALPEETRQSDAWLLPRIEAARMLGRTDQVRDLIDRLEKKYQKALSEEVLTASLATEVSWFYLVWKPNPDEAMKFARHASSLEPDHPLSKRVLGMAHLASDEIDTGLALLKELVDHDAFAAAAVARVYVRQSDNDQAKAMIERAAGVSRSGPGARMLRQVAREVEIKLPEVPGAKDVAEQFEDSTWIRIAAVSPERFLRITLSPVSDAVEPGEPIEVRAVLENLSEQPLPLGPEGVFQPLLHLRVVTGAGRTFDDLPLLSWRGPRVLPGGKQLKTTACLDAGKLGPALNSMPFAVGSLTVAAIPEPVGDSEGRTRSARPNLAPEPVVIRRQSLVASQSDRPRDWLEAYRSKVRQLEEQLGRKDLPSRLQAGRKVALLVRQARKIELGQAQMPHMLQDVPLKPDALSLLRKALVNPSPVVRSEVLTGLEGLRLSEEILGPVSARLSDPSWLVRMRAIELIGQSRWETRGKALEHCASDSSEFVAAMARAFLPPERP